jgi:hypothetical protein
MKGYGILLPGLELAHDRRYGRPYFVKTKRAAVRALEHGLASWLGESAEVVKVEINSNTYTIRPC